ncbi:P-loop containing nucleoside triphosphate hydrolase protein [Irpex rosettiformis]|uniref:P-loop containing nucleoside triphosphate hydrolase protein n=1 Tax=Irpex rosettiformis TaxID=378272 RepID=A0ACB8U9B3_9APHY|nr:P-loop containing nucleoside triphosphate hydrolase protein [Irpex rosettiformis]
MTYIFHNIFPLSPQQLPVHSFSSQDTDALLSAIRQTTAPHLGISLQLSVDGRVKAIAFATPNEAFYVTLQGSVRGDIATNADKRALKSDKTLAGFSMARIALHIHRDKRWHVNGVDLSSLLVSTSERPLYPSDFIQKKVSSDVNRRQVNALWYPDAASVDDDDDDDDEGDEAMRRVCLRAWISAVCADADPSAMQFAKHVNTRRASIRADHFVCLENMMLCAELLENQKPIRIENEFTAIMSDSDGLLLENARFTTRVRRSNQTSVEFHTNDGRSIIGQAISAEGKTTKIQLTQGQYRSDIKRVVVHGREELTCSENAREEFVLLILQGDIKLTNQLFINLVWFPSGNSARAERPRQPPTTAAFMKLNESQKEVAAAMISPSHPIVIAHGPPGTGKTSTIAAATDYWITQGESAWIIAQSNVGVKNIARSFVDKGITDFKIIVSKEFYVEWHEHLYVEIQENLIRADDLSQFKDAYETERSLLGSRIILCTLSTLSNPVLNSCHMFKNMPVEKLVVDEASQINVFEYMHLFHKFEDLEKVCFFGDPKQLPPFGQDAVPQLQSIFDVKHLKPTAYFLNTQYRMPIPLGEFISREVYNSKLKSHHKTHSPSSVAFIDVGKGVEASAGKSWTVCRCFARSACQRY